MRSKEAFPICFLILLTLGSCQSVESSSTQSQAVPPGGTNDKSPSVPVAPVPLQKKRRVLIIGLDGTTGNQFHQAVWQKNRAPHLKALLEKGKYTTCTSDTDPLCARAHRGHRWGSEYVWKTGPGWASVITGVESVKHQVKDNGHDFFTVFSETSKTYPTLFKIARAHGLKTAAGGVGSFMTSRDKGKVHSGVTDYECGHGKNGPLVMPESTQSCNLDYRYGGDNKDYLRDSKLAQWMATQIKNPQVDLVMGVFDKIDAEGHAHGFDSNNSYFNAISAADELVGVLINAVNESMNSNPEEWLIMVTSDHGGHRIVFFLGDHGTVYDEDEVIPFSVTLLGSSVTLKGFHYPVTHMDVHSTSLRWLGVNPANVDGQVQGIQ